MVQQKANPYSGFNFTVEIGDVEVGGFEEIEGVTTADTIARTRAPSLYKKTNITLKRGVIKDEIYRVWSSALEKGRPVQNHSARQGDSVAAPGDLYEHVSD